MRVQLGAKTRRAFESLPIVGRFTSEFADWCCDRGYSLDSVKSYLYGIRRLSGVLNRCGYKTVKELTPEHFSSVQSKLATKDSHTLAAVRRFRQFLEQSQLLPVGTPKPLSRVECELQRYKVHLQSVRGLAAQTIDCRIRSARAFISFIGYNRSTKAISNLRLSRIEAFVRARSRTWKRSSLKQLIVRLRSFLRFEYVGGELRKPVFREIEIPRIYREEQLPRALPWSQVQELLQSVDQAAPHGLRDYTMLYLMAAYGLRSSEVVALTLDDIDWRAGMLRVPQRKTRRCLILPLTNEAGDVLLRYLQKGRRHQAKSDRRELFLSHRAPRASLAPAAMREIFNDQVRRSGLAISSRGTHCLRHAFALRLLKQGVPVKTIGDALGHQSADSTGTYLRLAIDDLREASGPVPRNGKASTLLKPDWEKPVPRVQPRKGKLPSPPAGFRSKDSQALQLYLDTKKALGRKYTLESRELLDWDAFLCGERRCSGAIDGELFGRWANRFKHLCPKARRHQMETVRNFLLFYGRDHELAFVPDLNCLPRLAPPKPPRLISEGEMARLLATSSQFPGSRDNPLRGETLRIALLLLFCCGLRRGELLRLRLRDINLSSGLLYIEDTKFHKSRLVPFGGDLGKELKDYLELRRQRQLAVAEDSYLFLRRTGANFQKGQGLSINWRRLCLSASVVNEQGRPPRLHDLRHSAAVNALQRWYREGENVQAKLPQLALYLGHANVAGTHYYLHLTPALREVVSQKFRNQFPPSLLLGGEA